MVKELRDQWKTTMKEAEDIRLKYDGKAKDMPGDELERWTKAIEDCDRLKGMIEAAEKQDKLDAWGKELADDPAIKAALDGGHDDPQTRKTIQFVKDWPEAKTDDVKAFYKGLRVGQSGLMESERKSLSVGSDPGGGYLVVPQVVTSRIFEILRDSVYIRSKATVIPVTSAESLGAVAFDTEVEDTEWTAELGTGGQEDTEPFSKRELRPHPLAKRLKISKKLVRMAPNAPELMLSRMVYKVGITEEKAFLTGNGNNQPLGLLTESAQGISTARNKATAAANVAAADDFWKTLGMLKHGYRSRASWLIHRNMETRIRILKDANNNYIWQPGLWPSQMMVVGLPQTICGIPYNVTEYMTDPADSGNITTGTFAAIVGDFSYYCIADALQMEMQMLYELYAESNQVGVILRRETDAMPMLEEAFARMKVA